MREVIKIVVMVVGAAAMFWRVPLPREARQLVAVQNGPAPRVARA